MGVLLTLHFMEPAKRDKLEHYEQYHADDTLDLGMEFLETASSVSALAGRYVELLRNIRGNGKANEEEQLMAEPHRNQGSPDAALDFAAQSQMAGARDNGLWSPRPSDLSQDVIYTDFSEFNGLLYGTGLPRDLLPSGWDWPGPELSL